MAVLVGWGRAASDTRLHLFFCLKSKHAMDKVWIAACRHSYRSGYLPKRSTKAVDAGVFMDTTSPDNRRIMF